MVEKTISTQSSRIMIQNTPEIFSEAFQKEISLSGWVHRIRRLKQVVFVVLRDRTGLMQCVLTPQAFDMSPFGLESVIQVTGILTANANDFFPFELVVSQTLVLNQACNEPPVQINGPELEVNLDTLLNNRVLTLRHPREQAIFRIHAALSQAFSNFLSEQEFMQIFSPKLVKEGAEGGANVFQMNYFGQTAYLAQSPQFYKQMMVIAGFERVYEIAPVFRAEAHSTSRHLNEYISLDVEMGFISSEYELMALETELLRNMLSQVSVQEAKSLAILGVTLPVVPTEIPAITFNQALALLKTQFQRTDLDGDLDPEAERQLGRYYQEKTGSEFLFVTDYPKRKRPMYAMPLGESGTRSFDLLFRGLEITTGGLRIHQRQQLVDSMVAKGLNPHQYSSYLQAFDHGVPPHGGFAIGLERLTTQLLGYANIRRASAFPRDGERLVP